MWDDLGLKHYADGIVTSADLGCQKPDTAFFVAAARITKAAASGHLLIDDSKDNVKGARLAGWQAKLWDGTASLPELLKTR